MEKNRGSFGTSQRFSWKGSRTPHLHCTKPKSIRKERGESPGLALKKAEKNKDAALKIRIKGGRQRRASLTPNPTAGKGEKEEMKDGTRKNGA